MPVVRWTFIACTLLGIAGVFLPSIVVDKLGRHAELSLYRAQANRAEAARFIAAYRRSHGRAVGDHVIAKVMAKTAGRARDALDDTQSLLEAVDDVSDDDARLYGRIAAMAVWADLVLASLALLLVLGDAVQGVTRRGRMIAAAALTAVCLAIAAAAHVVCAAAIFEVNDDLGVSVLELGSGAYVMPGAIAAALVAVAVAVGIDVRRARRSRL